MTWNILGLAALAMFLWLLRGIWQIGRVSRGTAIAARPGKAFVMIDLQSVFWQDGPYAEADKTRAQSAILEAVAAARAEGQPIIALRQEWSLPATRVIARLAMKGQALAGSPGTEIAAPFAGLADHEVVKRVQDGFETGALEPLLERLGVGHLQLAGLDTNHCVAKTAMAARARGYQVTLDPRMVLAADSTAADKTLKKLEDLGVTIG